MRQGAGGGIDLETGEGGGRAVMRGEFTGVGERDGDFHGRKGIVAKGCLSGVRARLVLHERRDDAAGARGDQGLQVGGERMRWQCGITHGQVKQGFAEDGVLKRGIPGGGAHGLHGFVAEAGNAIEAGGHGGRRARYRRGHRL